MGYYSDVAIVMLEETFKGMEHKFRTTNDKASEQAIWCIENCHTYYRDTYQPWRFNHILNKSEKVGDPKPLVILHWDWIKAGSMGIQAIRDYVLKYGGGYARVGEEIGDVEMEYQDPEGMDYVEWYDYIEPVSYVEIKEAKEAKVYKDFKEFRDKKESK